MGKKNRCVYSLCQNSAENCGENVFFLTFPRPKKDPNKCERWIEACNRYDLDLLTVLQKRTVHICSLHFVGENGPTSEYPDPIPFTENQDTMDLMVSVAAQMGRRSKTVGPPMYVARLHYFWLKEVR